MLKDTSDMTEAECAAELMAENLSGSPSIVDVGVSGEIVSVTVSGAGFHFANYAETYEYDIHLLCDPDEINSGALVGEISDSATVYANFAVRGLADDAMKLSLPTHVTTKSEVKQKPIEEIPERIRRVAERVGIELE